MRLEEIPEPTPGPGEVIVRVAACGICGSDLEGYVGAPGMRNRRVPPLLLGHEFGGIVERGPGAWVGKAVAVNPMIACHTCPRCRAGQPHLCPERTLIGLDRPGAMAERVAVPATQLYPLPPGVPAWRGALAEPLAVALHALELAGPLFGRRVMVFGGGAIGYLTAWIASRAGARVRVVEINEARRRLLEDLGLTGIPAPEGEAEVTVDTVGLSKTRRDALMHTAPGGTAIVLGLHDDESALNFYPLILQERRIQGSYTYTDADFRRATSLAGEIPEGFFTRLPLAAGAEAFAALAEGQATHLKILLEV